LEYPNENRNVSAQVRTLRSIVVGNFRVGLIALFGFVLVVLFMVCASVANLSLARVATWEREVSIRLALGASKTQLLRQVLTESLLLSASATIAGTILAIVLVHAVLDTPGLTFPLARNIRVDWRALFVAVGLAAATGVGFGLAPAVQAFFTNLNESLKQTSARSSESRRHRNLSRWLVVLQSFAAAALLVFSSLLLRSFLQAARIDPGFSPDHLLGMYVSIPTAQMDYDHPGKIGALVREALRQIRSIPGVESAAFASDLPLNPTAGQAGVLVEGNSEMSALTAPTARGTLVSPGYFRTLGVPILQGRDFDDHDTNASPTVVIVNQAFVHRFLDGHNATRQRVALASDPKQFLRIVGVVGDVRQVNLERSSAPQVYLSLNQQEHIWLAILARTRGNPMQFFVPIREAVERAGPEVAVFLPKPMEQIIQQQGSWRRFETALVTAFAVFALFLAAFGTYSVISNVVSHRIPEIGIRMALGASPRDILRHFIVRGIAPAILGGFAGIVGALAAARLTASLLYEIGPYDWYSYAFAALTIVVVSTAATYIAARRAALLNPSRALRYE
jgi:putative ABC transport system permease protein